MGTSGDPEGNNNPPRVIEPFVDGATESYTGGMAESQISNSSSSKSSWEDDADEIARRCEAHMRGETITYDPRAERKDSDNDDDDGQRSSPSQM